LAVLTTTLESSNVLIICFVSTMLAPAVFLIVRLLYHGVVTCHIISNGNFVTRYYHVSVVLQVWPSSIGCFDYHFGIFKCSYYLFRFNHAVYFHDISGFLFPGISPSI
jgi:hypothetical protein